MRVARRAVLLAFVVACSPLQPDAQPGTSASSSETTAVPPTTTPLVAGCVADTAFSEGGEIVELAQTESDSAAVGAITWTEEEFCETFTIDFITAEGAPATTPPSVSASYVADLPIIRIELDTENTIITDQLVETSLVDRLYVVNAVAGGMFIDVHLANPAQAQIGVSASPAALTLSLQSGIVDYQYEPVIGELVVLTEPIDGATGSQTLVVEGYSRPATSSILVIATADGEVIDEQQATTASSHDSWGQFLSQLELPLGEYSIFIGEETTDGGLEGLTIDVVVE